jgi:hypothetical protein
VSPLTGVIDLANNVYLIPIKIFNCVIIISSLIHQLKSHYEIQIYINHLLINTQQFLDLKGIDVENTLWFATALRRGRASQVTSHKSRDRT